ncbi:MAG TPA: response regulator, partial [Candidatus Binatia bacterium]|nr:response regulator [Candidatus Binatia bacterium]
MSDSSDSIGMKDAARWGSFRADLPGNNTIRILTVDDNEALRYAVVRSLRDAGYEVVEAKTGAEALARAAELPDLITLDINLPDISGYQVCRKIKADPATTHIPILHVSSTFVDPQSRIQGLEGGADAYLSEPIDRGELVATVGALLRLKRAETTARLQAEAAEAARRELTQLNATLEVRVSERTAELKTANEGLRELSVRLLLLQDEERRRIARELHDTVGQLLAAITMNMAVIEPELTSLSPEAQKAFLENRAFVQQILQGIRTISHLLHPPLLDESGLPSALSWYVEEFSERSGIKVNLELSPHFERFASDLETAVFRIVQEALGNIHRHSQSPTADIRLTA